jgi:hypothetical protein
MHVRLDAAGQVEAALEGGFDVNGQIDAGQWDTRPDEEVRGEAPVVIARV